MPDEVADYSNIPAPPREENASAPAAPRETVVTDYTVWPQMIATLRDICARRDPRKSKQVATVAALLPGVFLASGGDPRVVKQVLDLLPSGNAYRDLLRGMVAAAVAWLRAAEMQPDDLKSWLDKLLKTNQEPFILGFTATDAMRWCYDYSEELLDPKGKHGAAPGAFALHRPDPSSSVTEDQAKKQAFEILRSARLMNPAPLARGGHGG